MRIDMRRARTSIIAFSFAAFGSAAHAGTVADGTWKSALCGTKPPAAALDLSDPDAYNASVAAVDTYRQAIRGYIDCLVKEGNADIQAIAGTIKAEQQAATAADDKILADVKAADAKFGDGGGK